MPETRWEKLVAGSMLCVLFALSALIVVNSRPDRPDARANSEPRNPLTATVAVSRVTQPAKPAAQPVAPKSPARAKAPRMRLVLTATGGDTWLTVRARTAQGKSLYFGILPQGQSITLAGRVWARFGGASDLAARLNGKPLELPAGTYNALITADGLRKVAV